MRFYLLGMPGSGKSFLGQEVANQLQMTFVDTDEWIESKHQCQIPELFVKYGEEWFRKEEKKCIQEICQNDERALIATGGGLPCYHQMMQQLLQTGICIYLKGRIEKLESQIKTDLKIRPLLANKALPDILTKLLQQREAIYLQSQHVVDIEKIQPLDIIKIIHSYA
ncbi:MAG: shikimate kinase [Bacteroidetes bacterium]|nr:shikimate kinase [Bacteroidota bacterium]